MSNRCVATLVILVIGRTLTVPSVHAQEATQSEREARYHRYLEFPSYIKGGSIQPHWMADGSSFWYAEGAPDNTVIYKVDPSANTRTPLFDTARLRVALEGVLGQEPPSEGLPFEQFTFTDVEETAVEFAVGEERFVLQLDAYTIAKAPTLSEEEESRLVPRFTRRTLYSFPDDDVMEVLSPDGRWFADIRNDNVWLRSTSDGRTLQLTTDGVENYGWGDRGQDPDRWAWWSPTGSKLAVKKEDRREVQAFPIVDWLGPTEEVTWVTPVLCPARGPCTQTELVVVDIASKRQVRIDTGAADQLFAILGWQSEGSELFFLRMNREYKKVDLMTADPETGATRVILTETQKTFVMGWELPDAGLLGWLGTFTLLEDGQRFIWASERDGWRHLYLYDTEGALIRRLTEGPFPVVGGITVDEEAGWVYFHAHGDRQRPYDLHLYRVSLDGTGFTRLTDAPGEHFAWGSFAPSMEFFIDAHSSVDRAPTAELRRADGTLLQVLAKANIDALEELKWSPPEEFVVKAADGTTDLYGILYKPYDFDPNKKYPVIEHIYAGPQSVAVPHNFSSNWLGVPAQALAQLGFVTFIVDGRGTPDRGKAFQDVIYGNIGRHEIPDHVATLKQLGEERPYMDLDRVGVWGGSSGGYAAVRAMLQAPDVYHVGAAWNPDVQRIDHADVPYMGLPEKNPEGYDYGSNVRLAGELKGKLLLIQSTADPHGTFAWTMKLVDALIRADKPYDLLVLPNQGHSPSGTSFTYMQEAIRRYFQEHLKPEGS